MTWKLLMDQQTSREELETIINHYVLTSVESVRAQLGQDAQLTDAERWRFLAVASEKIGQQVRLTLEDLWGELRAEADASSPRH